MIRRFSEVPIIAILREGEAAPIKAQVCRQHGISKWRYYHGQRQ